MANVTADALENGGWVRRGDRIIGRITSWGRKLGVRCMLHRKCSIAVSKKCDYADCVKWLAQGVPTPAICSDEVRDKVVADHFKAPRPRAVKGD